MMTLVLLLPALTVASRYPEWYLQKLRNGDRSELTAELCNSSVCEQPSRKYTKMLPVQPGFQWDDAGGYCGAWSFQRTVLAKGAYISSSKSAIMPNLVVATT